MGLSDAYAVDDAVVEQVHDEIRLIQRDALVDTAIRIGSVIVHRFYDGDLAAFRSHGAKESSLRRLATRFEQDESPGMSASGLYRCVALYELDQRVSVSGRKHLTVTHVRAVLGLPEAEQARLLEQAEAKGWTGEQLEAQAGAVRKKASGKAGPAGTACGGEVR